MRVFLQTRGRSTDYRFIGQAPAEIWWLDFRSFTSFEKPTLLLTSNGKGWKAYFSGIPSRRLDRVNTQIRYSLVIEGQEEEEEEIRKALMLAASWVADAASPVKPGKIQAALDKALPEKVVEDLLGDRDKAAKEIEERLRDAISALCKESLQSDPPSVDLIENVVVSSPGTRTPNENFLDRVNSLLRSKAGKALMVNLVRNADEAEAIFKKWPEAAVLLVDPNSSSVLFEKKKPLAKLERRTDATSSRVGRTQNIFFITIIIILAGTALLVLGLQNSYRTDFRQITATPRTGQSAR